MNYIKGFGLWVLWLFTRPGSEQDKYLTARLDNLVGNRRHEHMINRMIELERR